MKKILFYIGIAFIIPATAKAQFETVRDSVVQLYGIVMTADSLVGIPAVSIMINGQNRGTITNGQGVFSIVALKGDVIDFTHVSYKPKQITIPKNLEGSQYSIVQLMVADTVYLPATIIRPRPTPEQFARDFVNSKVDDDDIEVARKNTDAAKRRILLKSVPGDAGDGQQAFEDLVEGGPDPVDIVAFRPAGERYARSRREKSRRFFSPRSRLISTRRWGCRS